MVLCGMNQQISELIKTVLPHAAALRKELHTYPETALQESGTRERLIRWFEKMGVMPNVSLQDPLIGTDLVFQLEGNRNGLIGLRADMDALPGEELTGVPYASKNPGAMHACGHDGHMAILAGTAAVLSRMHPDSRPSVRFIFQPGEEEVCAGADLVEAGVCSGLQKVYALHGFPGIPKQAVTAKPGIVTAAAGTFSVKFQGESCHGAVPQAGNNPLPSAAAFILKMSELHRQVSQQHGAVVSCCSVQAGGRSTNVIPGTAEVRGTVRFLDSEVGAFIEAQLRRAAAECEHSYGTAAEIDYQCRYRLPVVNDQQEFERVQKTASAVLGEERFTRMERHTMVAEDFAFYLDRVPGCMFMLGMGETHAGLHSQYFDFDDDLIETGIQMMAHLATDQ